MEIQTKIDDALARIKNQEMREAMRLAKVDAYLHIKEMVDLGCSGTELSNYLAGMIRLEVSYLPKV